MRYWPVKCKTRSLPLMLGSLLGLHAPIAIGGPEGGEVVGGEGSIVRSDSTTTINQMTDRMVINWQSYDLAAGERVDYIQPDSTSVSLNRIQSHSGSEIYGRINANGHVILSNPNGVFFGAGAVVNAGGIMATGLSIDPANFMNGDFTFRAIDGTDGHIVNHGLLNAATGGSVTLLGTQVTNAGLISAELGAVTFATGREAVVTFGAGSFVGVRVTEALLEDDIGIDPAIINSGEIRAEDGKVLLTASTSRDIFSHAVNHEDMDYGRSVVVHEDGSYTLGGGADVDNTGTIDVSGRTGGSAVMLGETVTHSGTIDASSIESPRAGRIELTSTETTLVHGDAQLLANAEQGQGGDIKILGERVGILGATTIEATGRDGGGQVLIGGDYRGENPAVRTASRGYFGEGATITANATEAGDGGRVILWADDRLDAYGTIDARGNTGNGGFVETSSGVVNLDLSVDVSSVAADAGLWLIDPYNIIIADSDPGNTSPVQDEAALPNFNHVFSGTGDDSFLSILALQIALSGGSSVLVETAGEGEQLGNIDFNSPLNYDEVGSSSLRLEAHNDININATIFDEDLVTVDSLNLTLIANSDNLTPDGQLSGGGITIAPGASIQTQGGNFYASGDNFTLGAADTDAITGINTGGGTLRLYNTGAVALYNNVVTEGGAFTVGGDHDNDAGTADRLPTSFANYFFDADTEAVTGGAINTGGANGGGAITLRVGGNGVRLGELVFDSADNQQRSGDVTVVSGGDIRLEQAIDYQGTGGSADGSDDDPILAFSLSAVNDIVINHDIYDSGPGNVDTLNISLTADSDNQNGGSVSILGNIETAGGNFTARGASFNNANQRIYTQYAPSGVFERMPNNTTTTSTTTAGGDITIISGGEVSLGQVESYRNDDGSVRGALDITAGGAISATGPLVIAGTTTLNAHQTADGASTNIAAITLDNADNDFQGNVAVVRGGNVMLTDSNSIQLGAAEANMVVDGTLSVTALNDGDITDSGGLRVGGTATFIAEGNTITLDSAPIFGGAQSLTAANATVHAQSENNAGLVLGTVSVTNDFTLSADGAITDEGVVSVGNTLYIAAVDTTEDTPSYYDVTLDSANFLSQVEVEAARDVSLRDVADGIDVELATVDAATSSVTGRLNVDSAGLAANASGGNISITTSSGNGPIALGTVNASAYSGEGASEGSGGAILVEGFSSLHLSDALSAAGFDGGAGGTFTANGGDGANTFTVDAGHTWSGGAFRLEGQGGEDIFYLGASTSGVFGGNDNDRFVVTAPNISVNIDGGFGEDSIEGLSHATAVNTWHITAEREGAITHQDGGNAVAFEGVESVLGGNHVEDDSGSMVGGADIFRMQGSFTQVIDGREGINTVTMVDGTHTIALDDTAAFRGAVTGTYAFSFANMQHVNGAGSDTLTARNQNNTWTLGATTSTVAQTVPSTQTAPDTLTFTGMHTLNGGSGEDLFAINAAGSWQLNGHAGADTFVFGAMGSLTDAGSGIDGGTSVDSEGVAHQDRIVARNAANTWSLNATDDSDTNTIANSIDPDSPYLRDFKHIEQAQGAASAADHFDFAIAMDLGISAGASGGDVVDVADVIGDVALTVDSTWGVETYIGNNDGLSATANTTTLSFASVAGSMVAWSIEDTDDVGTVADGVNDGTINNTITFRNINNLSGGAGNDSFAFDTTGPAGVSGLIRGGEGSDSITGRDVATTWDVAPASGNASFRYANGLTDDGDPPLALESTTEFVGFETLTSGSANDTFTVSGDPIITLNAGGGTDIITLPNRDQTIGLGDRIEGLTLNGFETITAHASRTNALTVSSASAVNVSWLITAANSGTVQVGVEPVVTFNNFQILTGGDGDDVFNFSTATASVVLPGTSTGEIHGAGGSNTLIGREADNRFEINAANGGFVRETGVSAAYVEQFTGIQHIEGYAAFNDTFIVGANGSLVGSGSLLGSITGQRGVGSGGRDSLSVESAPDEVNEWRLLGGAANPDRVRRLAGTAVSSAFTFSPMASLTGGTGTDRFVFMAPVSYTGTIDARDNLSENDVDIVDLSTISGALSATLSGTTINGVQNAERVIGNGATSTLNGANSGTSAWRIAATDGSNVAIPDADGVNDGVLSSNGTVMQFLDFAVLNGGAEAADHFNVIGDARVASMHGGTSSNLMTPITDSVTVAADNSVWALTTAFTGTVNSMNFSGIEQITANGSGDTLAGINQSNRWTITGTNRGTVGQRIDDTTTANTLAFVGMENLTGNLGDDAFILIDTAEGVGTVEGILRGGNGGDDRLAVQSGSALRWTISGENSGNVVNDADTTRVNEFSGIEHLLGSTGVDVFTFSTAGASISGLIDGNESGAATDAAIDVLDVAVFTNGVVVELGPETQSGSVVEGTSSLPNVNAYNVEEVRAAERDPEADENNQWLAITEGGVVIDWNLEPDDAQSQLNEGIVQHITNLDETVAIANTQTRFFNFGSLQGYQGEGGQEQSNISPNGGNITGVYRAATGARVESFLNVRGLVVVDVSPRIIRLEGNADTLDIDGNPIGNTVLRVAPSSALDGENQWLISGVNSGAFTAAYATDTTHPEGIDFTFTGVNHLQGGSGNDTFTFAHDPLTPAPVGLRDGSIDGGGGTDVVHVTRASAAQQAVLAFGASALAGPLDPSAIAASFPEPLTDPVYLVASRAGVMDLAGIETLTVGADVAASLISSESGTAHWRLGDTQTATPTGTVTESTLSYRTSATAAEQTLRFSGVQQVLGGAADDTFAVVRLGVAGSDYPMRNHFVGGAGNDTLNLSGVVRGPEEAAALTVSLDPTDTVADVTLAQMETLTLVGEGHRLIAADLANTWTLDRDNGGTLAYATDADEQSLRFSRVSHLVGGAQQDTFSIDGDGTLSGTIDGGGNLASAPDSVQISATATSASRTLALHERDANGWVIDSATPGVLAIAGTENVSATATHAATTTLIGANEDTLWTMQGVNAGNLSYTDSQGAAQAVTFTDIANLRGGTGSDTFNFNRENGLDDGLSGLLQGGDGDGEDTLNLTGLELLQTIVLGTSNVGELRIAGIEQLTASAGNTYQLQADNISNRWEITGTDRGSVAGLAFTHIGYLRGGSANDTFVLDRSAGQEADDFISGGIDGGADPATGTASDLLDLTGLQSAIQVSLDPTYTSTGTTPILRITGVDEVAATLGEGINNTLVGSNAATTHTWEIDGRNQGEVDGVAFSGVNHLLGRQGVDIFEFEGSGVITGSVDGGDHPEGARDRVDVSALSVANVVIGDTSAGFLNIEEYWGNGQNSTLTAQRDINNTWSLTRQNGGGIRDGNGRDIAFTGFTHLVGGDEVDIFDLAGGGVDGSIRAGEGNDRLQLHLGSGTAGSVMFFGGDDTDTVAVDGGSADARFAHRYTAQANGNASHRYDIQNGETLLSYTVDYRETEEVIDDVFTSTLTLNGLANVADRFTLGGSRFALSPLTPGAETDPVWAEVSYSNKDSMAIAAEQGDAVLIDAAVNLPGRFSVANAAVHGEGENAIIRAATAMELTTTGALGSVEQPLLIDTPVLALQSLRGAATLHNSRDLTLSALRDPAAAIDLHVAGSVSASTTPLSSAQPLRISSTGNMLLDNSANDLTGPLSLVSPSADITLNNGLTEFAEVHATNLTLHARGNVSDGDSGQLQVEGTLQIDGTDTGLITLDNAGHRFNRLEVQNIGALTLADSSDSGVTVQGQARDRFTFTADNAITATTLSAGDISLRSETQTVAVQNGVTASNTVRLTGEGVRVNGAVAVTDSTSETAIHIDGGSAAVILSAPVSAQSASGAGGSAGGADIVIAGNTLAQNRGATLSGGNIDLRSTGETTLDADITASETLSVTAGADLIMHSDALPTHTQAQAITLFAAQNMVTQALTADTVRLDSASGSITQHGLTTAGVLTVNAEAGHYQLADTAALVITQEDASITSASAAVRGTVAVAQGNLDLRTTGALQWDGTAQAQNMAFDIGDAMTMSREASLNAQANIDLSVTGALALAQLSAAETLTLNAGGAVSDANDTDTNITASLLRARTAAGFGGFSADTTLETRVATLDVHNGAGEVGLTNDGEVVVNALINNGDIRLINTRGNVILDDLAEADYNRSASDAREAGGVINANYDRGNVVVTVQNGALTATGQPSGRRPELVGDTINVSTTGGFGLGRQLVVYANTELIISGPGIRPIWAFGAVPTFGLTTDSDLIDPLSGGNVSELLVEVEAVEDVNPAVFTEVRNYAYENISIRMPHDQLYDDELDQEDDDEDEEGYYY